MAVRIMELDAHRRELGRIDEQAASKRDKSAGRIKIDFERLGEEHAVALKVNEWIGPEETSRTVGVRAK